MSKVKVAGNALLGDRVVEEATGQPAMTGGSPLITAGVDRAGGGKMDEAAFQGI